MSREYSRTLHNFGPEDRIRAIVQEELEDFFSAIKSQIERKIKQIDKNIFDIRSELDEIGKNKPNEYEQVYLKIGQIEKMIAQLRRQKERDIQRLNETIRIKSQEKDKSSLFKKTSHAPNLDSILFGEENKNKLNQTEQISPPRNHSKSPNLAKPKPPLPKSKTNEQRQPAKNSLNEFIKVSEGNRNNWEQSFSNNNSSSSLNQQEQNTKNYPKYPKTVEDPTHIERPNRLASQLNKNKNSFMRKKSLKKFNTIPEEQMEESLISSQE